MHPLFLHYPQKALDRFKKFHSKNPQVFEEFKRLSFEMRSTGRKKYGSSSIFEVMRWHRALKTNEDVFELNNDFRSIYTRLMIFKYPEFAGFFELRVEKNHGQKSDEQLKRESNLLQFMGNKA